MAIAQHLSGICKGAAIGFLLGLAAIATVDKKTVVIMRVLSKPVEWVIYLAQKILIWSDGTTSLMGWLGMAAYWMLLGALIGWGASVLHSKSSGD